MTLSSWQDVKIQLLTNSTSPTPLPHPLKKILWLSCICFWQSIQHEQMVNGGVDMIEASVDSHHFTLVIFPTAHQHHELEQAVFQVCNNDKNNAHLWYLDHILSHFCTGLKIIYEDIKGSNTQMQTGTGTESNWHATTSVGAHISWLWKKAHGKLF